MFLVSELEYKDWKLHVRGMSYWDAQDPEPKNAAAKMDGASQGMWCTGGFAHNSPTSASFRMEMRHRPQRLKSWEFYPSWSIIRKRVVQQICMKIFLTVASFWFETPIFFVFELGPFPMKVLKPRKNLLLSIILVVLTTRLFFHCSPRLYWPAECNSKKSGRRSMVIPFFNFDA